MGESVIRQAEADDAAALADLIGQLEYQASAADVADRLVQIRGEGRDVLVAELDGRVVGCLTTSLMRVLHRPAPVGRIAMMVVAEGLRGRGIGARLVRAAEAALAAHGCYMIEVTSHARRTQAHRFYEKLGYAKTSVRLARAL
ncbi:MAG: GNAT family N-acetyltransferase [Croceibacterium sp.]